MRKLRFCLIAVVLGGVPVFSADWLTDGGNPQRTAWQKTSIFVALQCEEHADSVETAAGQPAPADALAVPPLIIEQLKTAGGTKQVAIVSGIRTTSTDRRRRGHGDLEEAFRLSRRLPTTGRANDDPLCPEGALATPVVGPVNANGQRPFMRWRAMASCTHSTQPMGKLSPASSVSGRQFQGIRAESLAERDLYHHRAGLPREPESNLGDAPRRPGA